MVFWDLHLLVKERPAWDRVCRILEAALPSKAPFLRRRRSCALTTCEVDPIGGATGAGLLIGSAAAPTS
jgi:hypothetical protein